MEQMLQTIPKTQGERTLAEEMELQQKSDIDKFKQKYCPLCKNKAECSPFFDLHGNCWGYRF